MDADELTGGQTPNAEESRRIGPCPYCKSTMTVSSGAEILEGHRVGIWGHCLLCDGEWIEGVDDEPGT